MELVFKIAIGIVLGGIALLWTLANLESVIKVLQIASILFLIFLIILKIVA